MVISQLCGNIKKMGMKYIQELGSLSLEDRLKGDFDFLCCCKSKTYVFFKVPPYTHKASFSGIKADQGMPRLVGGPCLGGWRIPHIFPTGEALALLMVARPPFLSDATSLNV